MQYAPSPTYPAHDFRSGTVVLSGQGASAADGSARESLMAYWSQAVQRLSPLLGETAVEAMMCHCLEAEGVTFPWLAEAGCRTAGFDPERLRALLDRQTDLEAAAATDALRRTFGGLLESLVGTALATRLLASIEAASPVAARAVRPDGATHGRSE